MGAGFFKSALPLADDAARGARSLADEASGALSLADTGQKGALLVATESAIIREARGIVGTPQFEAIQRAHAAGKSVTVNISGRIIQYEPGLLASGITMFGENGFLIGREAFSSSGELGFTSCTA